MSRIDVAIVGATGYAGSELVRLLLPHPEVNIEMITSESRQGTPFHEVYPHFEDLTDLELRSMDDIDDADLDLVFLALPHGVSMEFIRDHQEPPYRIIDLSGDFRLNSPDSYKQWYGEEHESPASFEKAAFGLSELFRDEVRNAQLVANPGCYPTSATLGLAPLLDNNLIEPANIVVDAKSGVSGAGSTAKQKTHFPEVFGNFSAYGLLDHRHTPEIQQALERQSGIRPDILFTPHLLPIDRGILSTIYTTPKQEVSKELLEETYLNYYEKEHFVRVVDQPPSLKDVRGSNYCDVYVTYDDRTNRILTIATIDNLVKGASGQAVQNMNIMFGIIERTGLEHPPLSP